MGKPSDTLLAEARENGQAATTRVLVVLHIYYEQFADYYLSKLKNINGCEWDLIVTGHDLSPMMHEKVLAVKPDAVFLQTPNVGYDVWPFICAVKQTDLGKYSFVIKLHTKNQDKNVTVRLNGIYYDGEKWRYELVDSLIGSASRFRKVESIFASNPKAGIAYPISLDVERGTVLREDTVDLEKEMARLGFKAKSDTFCAGTMFAARAEALRYLQKENISEDLFQGSSPCHGGGSMAHVYERLLCMAVVSQGYEAVLLKNRLIRRIYPKLRNVGEWIFSLDRKGPLCEKYLTLFGHDFRLSGK